jgi:hypothetical protein
MALPRYQRTTSYQPQDPGGQGESRFFGSLAERLDRFSQEQQARLDRSAEREGIRAGQEAAVGQVQAPQLPQGDSIRGDAFVRGALTAHGAAVKADILDTVGRLELEHESDPQGFSQGVRSYANGLIKEVHPDVRPAVQEEIGQQAIRAALRVEDRFKKRTEAENRALILDSGERMKGNILAAMRRGDDALAYRDQAHLAAVWDEAAASGLIAPEHVQQWKRELEEALDREDILGNFERVLQGEGIEAAVTVLDRFNRTAKDLAPDAKEGVLREMEGMLARERRIQQLEGEATRAQASIEQARAASDLELAVRRGQASEAEIEAAFNGGLINGAKRTSLILELDKQRLEAASRADRLLRLQAALSGGLPLDYRDADDVKAASEYLDAHMLEWQAEGPEAFLTHAVDFTARAGVMPEQLRQFVRVSTRSGTPEQAVQGSLIVARLMEEAPHVLDTMPREEKAFGTLVAGMVAAGTDPTRAVELARNQVYEVTDAERDALMARLKADERDTRKANVRYLNSQVDRHFDPHLFRRQPEVPAALEGEFSTLFESYYLMTRDADSARQLAWTDVTSVWGRSEINPGRAQLMKYAPERLYGNGDRAPWMREQLDGELRAAGIEDARRVRVVADDRTARESHPTYALLHVDEDGLISPVLDEQSRPMRWRPDFAASEAGAKLRQDLDQRLDEARAARERTRERSREGERRREERGQVPMRSVEGTVSNKTRTF